MTVVSGRPLNVGCGDRYLTGWTNLDVASHSPEVLAWDVSKPLPLPNDSVPFAYSCHMLEHLPRDAAARFLFELNRVLMPGGIARIVVPDLEVLATAYLRDLHSGISHRTEWSRIHFLDQLTRRTPGGAMKDFLLNGDAASMEYARTRMGSEADATVSARESAPSGRWARLAKSLMAPRVGDRLRLRLSRPIARFVLATLLGPRGVEAFDTGWFVSGGEVHQWMYDEENLAGLFRQVAFQNITRQTPTSSSWKGWSTARLDSDPNGSPYKPESIYMEGTKARN